jgi:hypothetical protein
MCSRSGSAEWMSPAAATRISVVTSAAIPPTEGA